MAGSSIIIMLRYLVDGKASDDKPWDLNRALRVCLNAPEAKKAKRLIARVRLVELAAAEKALKPSKKAQSDV